MAGSGASPLEELARRANRDFPRLFAARKRTRDGLAERSERLVGLRHDQDASVVLMGSWGRGEVTKSSDDDFMLLVHGAERDASDVEPSIDDIAKVLKSEPGAQGIFGVPAFSERLVQDIGLDEDDNNNFTRRLLLMLESVPVTGADAYRAVRTEVLDRYLDESIKAYRPPRFFLNDIVRYWRTICVDFAGKEHEGPKKWGLRNAKLRTSRKILFAGGLLPILECFRFDLPDIRGYLERQLDLLPTDRIAESFLVHSAIEPGARTFGAYDEFVGLMDDQEFREELSNVVRDNCGASAAFADVQRLGHELQDGLLALLYETRELPKVVRDYTIF
ncbi:MAG: hypothetical protein AB7V58_12585 [Solirubrobacterales bacterium]